MYRYTTYIPLLLQMALEEAKSVQQTLQEEKFNLEYKVTKYEFQIQVAGLTGSSVSPRYLHALEQEVNERERGKEEDRLQLNTS